jgi:translation initiation factor IF-1
LRVAVSGEYTGETEKPADAVEAMVVETLPHGSYRVELETRERVVAHAAPATAANFVRLRPKDRVLVQLSQHDRTRGRILRML